MQKDNKKYTGVFSEFSSGAYSEPKNITSDMWTPISVSNSSANNFNKRYNSESKDTDFISSERNRDSSRTYGQYNGQNSVNSQSKRQTDQYKAPNTNKKSSDRAERPPQGAGKSRQTDNISDNRHTNGRRTSERGNSNQRSANSEKTNNSRGNSRQQRPPEKRGTSGSRAPSGRDTRSSPSHAKPPVSQREIQMQKQNRKNVHRSNDQYDKRRNSGASHNEIMRENSDRKKKRGKYRYIISVAVVALFVACFIFVYSYSNGALVQNVIIEGDSIYTDKQIVNVSEIKIGDNMLGIKKKQVSELIETKLPYIYDAQVDFALPDTVTITVTGTTDKFLINNINNYICLDENNKILSLKKKKLSPGYYRVDGFDTETVEAGTFYEPSESNKERLEITKSIVLSFEENSMEKAAIISVADLADIQVVYDSRIRIYLGKCDDLQSQMALAIQTIKHSASGEQKGYVDMRYSDTAYFSEGSMDAG